MKKPSKSKKPSRLKRPKLPNLKLDKLALSRSKGAEDRVNEALQTVPRITNETIAEHREDVLSSARKYIYPLQHSKHRVVRTSIALMSIMVVVFFVYSGLALYKFQSTSGFIYDVTRVIPFPVAKAGPSWVSYESYLFELRRNIHYYETQQQANFSSKDGKDQLTRLKQEALAQVIENAYVNQLASTNHISVSDQAVDNEVSLVRSQNRLGNSDRVFDEVLNQFWGWSESDFKRELSQQMLQQAVVAKLDTNTQSRAASVLSQLKTGVSFATLASQYSDDLSTKTNGGQYAETITENDSNIPPQITAALFQLKAGEVSTIINTGYTLDIVKVLSASSSGVQAAHIQFTFQPITVYTNPLQAKEKASQLHQTLEHSPIENFGHFLIAFIVRMKVVLC